MLESLKDWVSNIIAIIFFITLIEILIPDGKIKKYIGLITGVLVIITIATPMVKALGGEIKFEIPEISSTDSISKRGIEIQSKNLSELQSKQIMRVYKDKMEKSIKEQLMDLKDVECREVICHLYEDNKEKLGEIKKIEVFLVKKLQKEQIKGIKPVQININIKKAINDKETFQVPESIKNEVIRKINAVYKVDSKNIKIAYSSK